ncbi:MAG: glycosyltransferase family 25 protein [Loktanella sp.]|nr:glycosyltransferase family 25 protein [Loktanella sp.]
MTLPVIILSLEDAVERRAPLLKEFEVRGVPFEVWHAVDGRNGLAPEFEQMIDRDATRRNLGRPMGNAEYGCALSHHLIYRAIVERGLDAAVILEDDAIVDDQFFRVLAKIAVPSCDLILFDYGRALVSRNGRVKLSPGIFGYRCRSSPILTTGYLVTQSGAKKLLEQSTPVAALADWPTDIAQLTTYVATPRLVDHPDIETTHSDIQQDREKYDVPVPRQPNDPKRFLKATYWRKTYYKRLGKWVS